MGKKRTHFYTFLMFQEDYFPKYEEKPMRLIVRNKKKSEGANVMENCELFQEELIK